MKRFSLFLFYILFSLASAYAADYLYIVGGFNNWDINNPLKVGLTDGIFEAEIDFSKDVYFKMSTADPCGAWKNFDKETIYPVGEIKEDEWLAVEVHSTSPNISAPSRRAYALRVDPDNMKMIFSTGGAVATPWSGTLPVMFIETENRAPVVSKDDYLSATYYLDPMGAENVEAIGSAGAPLGMQIRGRGNYTWVGFEKKPYRIKLDKKAALMGMDKSKHFALLAHADDNTGGLRNMLGFATSEALSMPWTPSTAPIEVVLNGDYIGLYWLTETVRVDADRVDVTEQADEATEDVDGGWLVEIDNYNTDPHVTVYDANGSPIWFTYKSPEVLSALQKSYLLEQMQAVQNAVASGDEANASALVDFDILARYFIVNQLMLDMESFHGSCYLYKQRGEGEKWMFGPVWDFGNSFAPGRADKPRFIFDHPDFSQVWIGGFYAMPSFVETVKEVWTDFLGHGFEPIYERLQQATDGIAVATLFDAKRWPSYAHTDVEAKSAALAGYFRGSADWLKQQWGAEASVVVQEAETIRVEASGEGLAIWAPAACELAVYTIDGRRLMVGLVSGNNTISLDRGCYIVAGKKYFIH